MLEQMRVQPFTPPGRTEIDTMLGPEVTAALIDRGTLVKVSDAIVLERDAYDEAVRRIVAFLREHDRITVADARDLLGTSRKYMLAIFEELDERRITKRAGDDRMLGTAAPALENAG
jgi:selenocysteine-specific elongation factor